MLFFTTPAFSQSQTLQAGVAVSEVPNNFYGTWRIFGKLESTNNYRSFKAQSMVFWTLTRNGDTITLKNPMTMATASICVDSVEGNLITFTREVNNDDSKALVDKVTIRLDGQKFSGLNTLRLEYYSIIDGHLLKTDTATYFIKGEKVSDNAK